MIFSKLRWRIKFRRLSVARFPFILIIGNTSHIPYKSTYDHRRPIFVDRHLMQWIGCQIFLQEWKLNQFPFLSLYRCVVSPMWGFCEVTKDWFLVCRPMKGFPGDLDHILEGFFSLRPAQTRSMAFQKGLNCRNFKSKSKLCHVIIH